MKKNEALAVVEIRYFTHAVEVLDRMCKMANVEFLTSENYLGGRLVTIIVGGSISEVEYAVQVAKQTCEKKSENPLRMALTITNPHNEIMKYIKYDSGNQERDYLDTNTSSKKVQYKETYSKPTEKQEKKSSINRTKNKKAKKVKKEEKAKKEEKNKKNQRKNKGESKEVYHE